ncbi:MAG: hypothetical protein QXF26_06450 [Candidatus Bathyarchaeia archaeon]
MSCEEEVLRLLKNVLNGRSLSIIDSYVSNRDGGKLEAASRLLEACIFFSNLGDTRLRFMRRGRVDEKRLSLVRERIVRIVERLGEDGYK